MFNSFSKNSSILGIFWMIITSFFFVGVFITVKYIGTDLPASQSAFLRYLFGTLILFPTIITGFKNTQMPLTKIFAIRGFFHAIGVTLWFYSMTVITIAEVTAIGFLTPIFICIGASFLFKEKINGFRLLAIFLSFLGALVILRPGFKVFETGHGCMLLAAFVFSFSYLIAKHVSKNKNSAEVVAFLSFFTTIFLIPLAIYQWVNMSNENIILLFLTAILATLGHITMTMAIKSAPMVVIQPFTFLQLVWSVIFGFLLFQEKIDVFVILGGIIILISTSYLTFFESRIKVQKS
tara:strand:+ start:100 stop:978 length:879 start_codon:yes stop_codon:yes gene_type:complete